MCGASDKKSSPDERADAAQDDAQVVNHRGELVGLHAQSVRHHPISFKGSPDI